ncbi:hypothetical protein ANN_18756 [Periplaneta americana]|uniref:DUF4817 domain-containing protein n=1 Tax=Periplaneta americana TaxID=6978 RepID=A0ABQ8SQQ8_PERAM|nr:hypothetical protein ANN_18756 [Periplaneta americana]
MERWSVANRVAVVRFFHETRSVVTTQTRFCVHFNVSRRDEIPSRKTITQWMTLKTCSRLQQHETDPCTKDGFRELSHVRSQRDIVLRSRIGSGIAHFLQA